MADQASVNQGVGNGHGGPRRFGFGPGPEGVVGSLTEFGNDVAELTALQAQLAAMDLREAVGRTALPAAVGVVALVTAIGCVPVALIGLAYVIAAQADWSLGTALLATAGGALVLAIVAALIAVRAVVRGAESFRRTREELQRNLAWIRTVVVHSGRSYASARRTP